MIQSRFGSLDRTSLSRILASARKQKDIEKQHAASLHQAAAILRVHYGIYVSTTTKRRHASRGWCASFFSFPPSPRPSIPTSPNSDLLQSRASEPADLKKIRPRETHTSGDATLGKRPSRAIPCSARISLSLSPSLSIPRISWEGERERERRNRPTARRHLKARPQSMRAHSFTIQQNIPQLRCIRCCMRSYRSTLVDAHVRAGMDVCARVAGKTRYAISRERASGRFSLHARVPAENGDIFARAGGRKGGREEGGAGWSGDKRGATTRI